MGGSDLNEKVGQFYLTINSDILGVYMSFHTDLLGKTCDDKLIVWADWDCFNPINYTEEKLISPNGKNCTYVIAEKLFWRIMTEN